MMKIAVCDDHMHIIEQLRHILSEIDDGITSVCYYANEDSFIEDIEERRITPDVVIVDIKLHHNNGIVLARRILDIYPSCQIIFISGYDSYYLDVYEVDHIYYIKKPIKKRNVEKALLRASRKLEKEKDMLFTFSYHGKMMSVPFHQIIYMEKDLRKVRVHAFDGTYEFYGKMNEVEEKLPVSFARCHNSYIVNLNKVSDFYREKVMLCNEIEVPISRFYYKEIKGRLVQHLEQIVE